MGHSSEFVLSTLEAGGIREAARQTYPLWRQGRSFEDYHSRIEEALRRMGPNMRYVGLLSPTGTLLASCRLLKIALQWDHAVVPALGIAAVFVPPEHRGHGYAHRLLQITLREATREGMKAAVLYSDIAPAFYKRLGFIEYPAVDWEADTSALPMTDPYEVRPALPGDLARMLEWYHSAAAGMRLHPARSEALWRFFRWWRGVTNEVILADHGHEVGYLTVTTELRGMRVWEWAAPEAAPERLWATARRMAQSLGLSYMSGWLRPDRHEKWMTAHPRSAAIPMVLPLDADATLPPPEAAAFEELDHF
ncbi:MAG: GNAT family N-acetyltransferase [Chthonomonadales bacterium]